MLATSWCQWSYYKPSTNQALSYCRLVNPRSAVGKSPPRGFVAMEIQYKAVSIVI